MDTENLVNEGMQFFKLRQKYAQESNPASGTVGYLISLKWLSAYKKYVHYDSLKNN